LIPDPIRILIRNPAQNKCVILFIFMLQVRLKAQEKKVDHMERAKRLEEIPLLKEQHEDLKAERKQV
jgi:hypothetical protein